MLTKKGKITRREREREKEKERERETKEFKFTLVGGGKERWDY